MMTCWHADPVRTCQEVKSGVPVGEQEQLTDFVIKMSQARTSDIPSRLGKEEQGITFLFTFFQVQVGHLPVIVGVLMR